MNTSARTYRALRHLMLGMVGLILSALLLGACSPNPTAQPTATPAPADSSSKVDSVLLSILVRYATTQGTDEEKQKAAIDYARSIGVINKKDEVVFELELDGQASLQPVTDKIKTMGGTVTAGADIAGTNKIRVTVPVKTFIGYINNANQDNFLRDLAAFKGVVGITIVYGVQTNGFRNLPPTMEALEQVSVTTKNQGVKIMGADKWQAAGFTGKGVTVGIIDGGFKYYEQLRGLALPDDFQPEDIGLKVTGEPAIEDDVHGSAVSEIIHSIAPDAKLVPAAIFGSDIEFSAALDYMVSKNVNIVSISMGGNATSGDGNSPISKKIEQIRQQRGILFFISAGNEGDEHYAGTYDPDAQGFHQWVPGLTRMAIGNPSSAPFETTVILNWEQWQNGGANPKATDLDLFIETAEGKAVISSQSDQRSRPPREAIPLKIPPRTLYYLKVRQKQGTAAPTTPFRLHVFTAGITPQFYTAQMTIGNPADSRGAFAVGAVDPPDKDGIAVYSSQGPLTDGRFKPEISGPSGVASIAYAEEGKSKFPGTSASCPELSGLAALLKSSNPNLNADQLSQVILENVKDLGAKGPDLTFGYGRADITAVKPGAIQPKGGLPPSPTPNTNPQINLNLSKIYPTPAVAPVSPKPNATAPVVATAPATAATTPEVDVTFRDTFQDPATGLPNSGNTTYQSGGKYQVVAPAGQLTWGTYPASVSVTSFTAEVTAQGIANQSGIYGIVFWYNSQSDYYLLSVTGSGLVQVSQFNNGSWKEIIGWTAATNWKAGGANLLRLVTSNNQVGVAINNKTVKTGQASGSGGLGFAAGSYTGNQTATFSDFRLSVRQ